MPDPTPEERLRTKFFENASIGGTTACWPWRGSTDGEYGIVALHSRNYRAHRVAWLVAHGEIPAPEIHLHHVCQEKLCVNPAHLQPATAAEHVLLHRPTHCKNGHEFNDENALFDSEGHWICRVCRREWERNRWAETRDDPDVRERNRARCRAYRERKEAERGG